MNTTIIGFPRIGADRELKWAVEAYFKHQLGEEELQKTAQDLRATHWALQKDAGLSLIPVNDFSFYDNVLDTAVLLGVIPERYRALGLSDLGTYFAMAHGYQGNQGDVKALSMKKWFTTNYHYLVPEFEDSTVVSVNSAKLDGELAEARAQDLPAKPVLIGPFTFLKLAHFTGSKTLEDFAPAVAEAYASLLSGLHTEWVQMDEPYLCFDLTTEDLELFQNLYQTILASKGASKILLQTYFGDVRDGYDTLLSLDFDGIGLDFLEGRKTLDLVTNGFPDDKVLFAGVLNGRNIWRNHYASTLELLSKIRSHAKQVVLSSASSLLFVPYTTAAETALPEEVLSHFAFAEEKLQELADLSRLADLSNPSSDAAYQTNQALFQGTRVKEDPEVQDAVRSLTENSFVRTPSFTEREPIQKEALKLPPLPTTTIGSFPQTVDVRRKRRDWKNGELATEEYEAFLRKKIRECIALQENLGVDVLVHGEYERNDMVEYFGNNLDGFVFTEKAWVQSYGTRCVKPPIIWGDVARRRPLTIRESVYAQSLTDKPVKGMLTGPITILNWSFPREDISPKESAFQIALAIREEVLDLEQNGIRIIQIDEAALREKLPLRRSDWHKDYLDWAIPAFRLVHSGVRPETQIHTHMCYSEFNDIIRDIDAMDADVITFEASRSNLTVLDALKEADFRTEVGPGVYDIHSPRIPSVEESSDALSKMLTKVPQEKLWVNPDCGLKTRTNEETIPSLSNLVKAAKKVRETL